MASWQSHLANGVAWVLTRTRSRRFDAAAIAADRARNRQRAARWEMPGDIRYQETTLAGLPVETAPERLRARGE